MTVLCKSYFTSECVRIYKKIFVDDLNRILTYLRSDILVVEFTSCIFGEASLSPPYAIPFPLKL